MSSSYGNMLLPTTFTKRKISLFASKKSLKGYDSQFDISGHNPGFLIPLNWEGDILEIHTLNDLYDQILDEKQEQQHWFISYRSKDFDELGRLYHLESKKMPQKRFWNVLEACGEQTVGSHLPWEAILGKRVYREQVEFWAKDIQQQWKINVSDESLFGYYYESYQKTHPDKWMLQTFYVDVPVYEELRKEHPADTALSSFQPIDLETGECEVSTYTKVGSVTGRLVCTSGANPLRLKRVFRDKILKSKWEGGQVVSLDYAALEPRVLLWLNDQDYQAVDLYQDIADTWFADNGIQRDVIKTVVLSLLYGASTETIKSKLDIDADQVHELVRLIQDRFCLAKTKKQLINEAIENDRVMIYNGFGKPIFLDAIDDGNISNLLVNYFVQSTAVDVALLGFQRIFDRINSSKSISEMIRPLGVLHDALLLDLHPCAVTILPKLLKLASEPLPGVCFPVKATILS